MNKLISKLEGASILEAELLKVNKQDLLLLRLKRKKFSFLKFTLNGPAEFISQEDYSKLHLAHPPVQSSLVAELQESKIGVGRLIEEERRERLHLLIKTSKREFWLELVLNGPSKINLREVSKQEHHQMVLDDGLDEAFY